MISEIQFKDELAFSNLVDLTQKLIHNVWKYGLISELKTQKG